MVTYTYAYFTADDAWPIPADVTHVDALIVAGGGAGQGKQAGNVRGRGGGGAGGVLELLNYELLSSGSVSLLVGKGGTSGPTSTSATSGGDSVFDNQTAIGGGRGGSTDAGGEAQDGGSGGGTSGASTGTAYVGKGFPGQGHDGATGAATSPNGARQGGGGGASQAGHNGSTTAGSGGGGDGISLVGSIWEPLTLIGMPDAIAGGGGGGAYRSSGTHVGGPGGFGGGGEGGTGSSTVSAGNGKDAVPGTGSGGGGAGGNSSSSGNATSGGAGADGFVALRFVTALAPVVTDISPKEGRPGDTVTLTGTGFSAITEVFFGTVQASTVTITDDNTIEVVVPNNEGAQSLVFLTPYGITFTDAAFLFTVDSRITQLIAYSVDTNDQPTRFTQIVAYGITVPVQPVRFTQIPSLVPYIPRPVPFPVAMVPEIPLNEIWEWFTTVSVKDNGREQRSLLRETPRLRLSLEVITLDGTDYRQAYDLLWKMQGKEFLYPVYQYGAFLQPANIGDTKLYFDPKLTDLRSGDKLALFSEHTGLTTYVDSDEIEGDGATLKEPLDFDVGASWQVCPALPFRFLGPGSLEMNGVDGVMNIVLELVGPRSLQRVDNSHLLTVYDGYVVLDKRPLSPAGNEYDRNVSWMDSGTGLPLADTKWRMNFASGRRSFIFNRYQDMDYWRAFADLVRGRQKSFIHPTFFDDLPLAVNPALGATIITTTNIQADEYFSGRMNRYIRIERANGPIFRRVNDRKLNYDANGDPVSLNLILNQNIGSSTGSNQISKISFAPITRLGSDVVSLQHNNIDSLLSIDIRTVNE